MHYVCMCVCVCGAFMYMLECVNVCGSICLRAYERKSEEALGCPLFNFLPYFLATVSLAESGCRIFREAGL